MASAWRSQDGSQQSSRKERLPYDLETESPRPNNWQWDFHKAPPCPPQCLHKGTGESENSNGLSRVHTPADDGLIYKTASDINTAVTVVQEQLEKVSHWCQETTVRNQFKPGASPVVHPQQQSSRTSNASSLLQWRRHRTYKQSQIPRDPLRQYADVQDAGRINKTQVQERTVRVESHGFEKASYNVICSCCFRVWYSASLTIVWVLQHCHSLT